MSEEKIADFESCQRFSDRAKAYAKYRPGYPAEICDFCHKQLRAEGQLVVADIGSGTGLLSEIFLKKGDRVLCVEPNREMREMAEHLLADYPAFTSFDGRADSTGIEDATVDLIVAGQAFHWFDPEPTKAEFNRILKPTGMVGLIWNNRKLDEGGLMHSYQAVLLRHCPDYQNNPRKDYDYSKLKGFFATDSLQKISFHHSQSFDFQGLIGRLLSASYVPTSGQNYRAIMAEMEGLFQRFSREGQVKFEYETVVYYHRPHGR